MNWLAVSEAAPRLDPFGNVLQQRAEKEVRRICVYEYIEIFVFFKISVFSKIVFQCLFYFYSLPPCCFFVL